MRMFSVLLLLISAEQSEGYNKRMLGYIGVNCEGIAVTAPPAVRDKFFEKQHSLAMIDFTTEPLIDTEICEIGRVTRAFEVFDDISKVNLGKKIDKSGLSEHPRTRGILFRGLFNQTCNVTAVIAKHNPRSKFMVHLTDGSYEKAQEVLRDCFHNHKMLDVGVMMPYPNKVMIFCMYNPFAGVLNVRRPEFKCWHMKKATFEQTIQPIADFIEHRARNLQQYPLKVAIFQHPLLAWPVKGKKFNKFEFPDGDFIYELSRRMNFTPMYLYSVSEMRQGFQLANGSFTGSLDLIEAEKADFSANSLLISSFYNTSNVLFISSMEIEQFGFMIQKRKASTDFGLLLFSEFDATSRMLFVTATLLFPIIYTIIVKLESNLLKKCRQETFARNAFYIIALQLNISMKHSKRLATRLVIASVLFLTLIMNSIFQGTIVSSLNSDQYDGTMNTMDDLVANNYRIVIHADTKAVLDGLGGRWKQITSDPNASMHNAIAGINEIKRYSNVAFLTSKLYTGKNMDQYYDNETGENLIEAVPEVIFEFYASPIIPKNSPFVENFKEFSMRYREYGLHKYQSNKAANSKQRYMTERLLIGKVPKQKDKTIELYDLMTIVQLYVRLNLVALLIFVIECFWKFVVLRIPTRVKNFSRNPEPPLFEFVL